MPCLCELARVESRGATEERVRTVAPQSLVCRCAGQRHRGYWGGAVVWSPEGLPCSGQTHGKRHHLTVRMELEPSLKENITDGFFVHLGTDVVFVSKFFKIRDLNTK